MKAILFFLSIIYSSVSTSQIPPNSPSGLYEAFGENKKVIDIEYEMYVEVDTIKGLYDQTAIMYRVKCKYGLICSITPRINDNEVRININYPNAKREAIVIHDSIFIQLEAARLFISPTIAVGVHNEGGAPILINIPVKYQGKKFILHLLQPHFAK